MNKSGWLAALLLSALPWSAAWGGMVKNLHGDFDRLNRGLYGRLVDYTNNHGKDNRIWSPSLHQRRDMYVYLPPHFDPNLRYPLLIWLHGFNQDEKAFAEYVAPMLDQAMHEGKLPPFIAAGPDGSLSGEPSFFEVGSFFLNTSAGDFENFIVYDVWDFLVTHFPIRPERQAHVLAGVSMGGFGAYNLGIKHRDCFGVVLGVFPPLNLRWVDCYGKYFANFNPKCWGWRTKADQGKEVIARFYGGILTIKLRQVIDPLFGSGPEALWEVARENPIEMLTRYHVCEGDLEMYIAYAGKDEFNIDAQVESFLYLAKWLGLTVHVGYDAKGHHNLHTAKRLFPGVVEWLAPLLAPYSPVPEGTCSPCPDGCNNGPALLREVK